MLANPASAPMAQEQVATPPSRRALWPLLGLVLLTAIVAGPSFGPWCNFTPDSFQYLGAARAMVEGGDLSSRVLQAPPGFPALIAPLLLLGDLPLLAIRTLLVGCWALVGALTYLLHRRDLGAPAAWMTELLVAASPVFLHLTTTVLSEPAFIVLALGALLVASSWNRSPAPRWSQVVGGALLAGAAIMVRAAGLVLVPVMAIALLRQRGRSTARRIGAAAVFGALAILPSVAWQAREGANDEHPGYLHTWTHARGGEHTDATGLALQVERLVKYGPAHLHAVKQLLLPEELFWRAYQAPFDLPTTWLIGGGIALIALVRLVKYGGPMDAYVLGLMLVVSLWPWDEGVRFAAPVLPIVAAYPLWLGRAIWRHRAAGRGLRFGPAAALLVLLAAELGGLGVAQARMPAQRRKAEQRLAAMRELADWHAANTAPGAKWLGVTPNGDTSKVLLVGAAYLARRPVETIDVNPGETMRPAPGTASCILVHKNLTDSAVAAEGFAAAGEVGDFVVWRQAARQPEGELGTTAQPVVRSWEEEPGPGSDPAAGAGNVSDGTPR